MKTQNLCLFKLSSVKRTPEMKSVPFTWVFRMKLFDVDGKKFMEKDRCCLRGDRKLAYVDFKSTNEYASMASHDSIRMLLSMTANQELLLESPDTRNAYFYGELDKPIIMDQITNSTQRHPKPVYLRRLEKSFFGNKKGW